MKDFNPIEEQKKFENRMPSFSVSGKYLIRDGKIVFTELDLNAEPQVCSTPLDFSPEWRINGNKIILELTPNLV